MDRQDLKIDEIAHSVLNSFVKTRRSLGSTPSAAILASSSNGRSSEFDIVRMICDAVTREKFAFGELEQVLVESIKPAMHAVVELLRQHLTEKALGCSPNVHDDEHNKCREFVNEQLTRFWVEQVNGHAKDLLAVRDREPLDQNALADTRFRNAVQGVVSDELTRMKKFDKFKKWTQAQLLDEHICNIDTISKLLKKAFRNFSADIEHQIKTNKLLLEPLWKDLFMYTSKHKAVFYNKYCDALRRVWYIEQSRPTARTRRHSAGGVLAGDIESLKNCRAKFLEVASEMQANDAAKRKVTFVCLFVCLK